MPASEPAPPSRAPAYFIAGLLHAAAMLLAFPPVGLWGFVFIAPLPVIWAGWIRGRDLARYGRRARLGRGPLVMVIGSMPLQAYAQQWVLDVSAAGFVPMILILSGMTGVLVWVLSLLAWRWPHVPLSLMAAVAWTAMEFFRGELFLSGYPWILIAHPLIDAPLVPAGASLLGTYFVGFLVVMVAGGVMDVLTREGTRWRLAVPIGVAVGALVGSVLVRPDLDQSPPLRLGIVQTNIPQSNKIFWEWDRRVQDFQRFSELTRQAAKSSPDVIVWPETMFPGMTLSELALASERAAALTFPVARTLDPRGAIPSTEFYDRLTALSAEVGSPLLVGALGIDGLSISSEPGTDIRIDYKARYNSVFLVSAGKVEPESYNKLELTPFGEVMPGIRHWPWLQDRLMALGAGGMTFDLAAGAGPHAFELPARAGTALVTPVCFEATKPALCRRLARAAFPRPVVMVNLTNDGWFGSFRTGRLQHLQVARWRCAELGVPMVRAANTGISAAIDARGRVLATGVDGQPGDWNVDGVLSATVSPSAPRTLYARVGDVFGWTACAVAGAMLVIALVRPRMPGLVTEAQA